MPSMPLTELVLEPLPQQCGDVMWWAMHVCLRSVCAELAPSAKLREEGWETRGIIDDVKEGSEDLLHTITK